MDELPDETQWIDVENVRNGARDNLSSLREKFFARHPELAAFPDQLQIRHGVGTEGRSWMQFLIADPEAGSNTA